MEKELKSRLKPISTAFYEWYRRMVIDNWRKPLEDPVDTFVNYDDDEGKELGQIFSEYSDDEETTEEIEEYFGLVVEAVNNGGTISTWGGARTGAGRKRTGRQKVPLTIQITPELNEKIRKDAEKEGVTISEYCTKRLS